MAVLAVLFTAGAARADDVRGLVSKLGSSTGSEVAAAIDQLSASNAPGTLEAFEALAEERLVVDEQGAAFIDRDGKLLPAFGGAVAAPVGKRSKPIIDNRVRRSLLPALARLRLAAPDPKIRYAAAEELAKRPDPSTRHLLAKAAAAETDSDVAEQLQLALAKLDVSSEDRQLQVAALRSIGELGDSSFEAELVQLRTSKDAAVRDAANAALGSIRARATVYATVGNLFYGISLGSVLLLAALGLAITFGLMRVINMAHGEMLMLGAYSTYVVQTFFQKNLPSLLDWYIVAALPIAFGVCVAAGVVLERTVVRFLYGRPLETLLATWGISLILIQIVRLVFGASNVTVANPSWLSGGYQLFPGVVLPYARLAVVAFVVFVVGFVAFLLQKTPLGLQVRSITQNREMAASMGISTRRVDMWTFGFGSGVAGLGGVALSQLGNVGPELGQAYIVDSFMVVVLGGVGNIAGTIFGALGLGMINKFFEPFAGAVLGKIIILVFVILFIQKRPQGLFALKGRAVEA